MLPKTSDYVENYDWQTKWMYLLLKIKSVLISKTSFDSESIYNIYIYIFVKPKKILWRWSYTTKQKPKVDSTHTCVAVISLYSPLIKDENYYP